MPANDRAPNPLIASEWQAYQEAKAALRDTELALEARQKALDVAVGEALGLHVGDRIQEWGDAEWIITRVKASVSIWSEGQLPGASVYGAKITKSGQPSKKEQYICYVSEGHHLAISRAAQQ